MGDELEALKAEMYQALREVDEEIAAKDERISSLEETVAKAFLALGEVAEALEPLSCRFSPDHEADGEREIAVTTGEIRKAKAVRERIMDLCHASPVPGCETSSAEGPHQTDDGEARNEQ